MVYAYNLQDAVREAYLKPVRIHGYTNPRSSEFVDMVVDDFLATHGDGERYEGMLPKLAFFAATIKELQNDLRTAVEAALQRPAVRPPTSRLSINLP